MSAAQALLAALAAEGRAALVTIRQTLGSAPREKGAWMAVRPSGAFSGTIGGGALEWTALAEACAALASMQAKAFVRNCALGPELGQCCGGRVVLSYEIFGEADREALHRRANHETPENTPLLLFGAGHVGRALILALAPLPFAVRWIDSRENAFSRYTPPNVECRRCADPAGEIDLAPNGAFIFIMTHSHVLDFDILARALQCDGPAQIGMIGSLAKRARFTRRLSAMGVAAARIAKLHCPIGVAGVRDKAPAAIAAATAAQLLILRAQIPEKAQEISA